MASTVTGCEDHEFAQLDAFMRPRLAQAAEAYASAVDLDARLKAVLGAGPCDDDNGAATDRS